MDKRRMILGIAITVLAVVGWSFWANHLRNKHLQELANQPPPASQPASTQPATTQSATNATTEPTTNPTTVATTTTQPSMATDPNALVVQQTLFSETKTAPLGSEAVEDPNWAMGLQLSPFGGGIDNITLNSFRNGDDFRKPLKERALYKFQDPYLDDVDASRPFSTAQITVDGKSIPLAGIPWKLESVVPSAARPGAANPAAQTGQQAVYTAIIKQSGEEKLKLTKTFTLFGRADTTKGYELAVDFAVENKGKTPVSVQMSINGPTLPPREYGRGFDRQLMAGYHDPKTQRTVFEHYDLSSIKAEAPSLDITKDKESRAVVWAGTASTYFNAFVLFEKPDQIAKVTARGQNWGLQPDVRPIYMSFDTTPQSLQPRASYSVPMSGFFGPRWREVLDAAPYNVPPRQYEDTLVITSGMCAICTFNWLVIGLVYLLNGFHWLAGGFIRPEVGDWGLAIIFLVALVRTCLHPITKMSQVQMMKMAKMGPALQKLKEKHGEDKEAFTRAQMELMKEQGMAPIFGCLPMFLQMPIWIALWQALQSTFELRQAPFLWGWTWIHDLSRPDYLIKFDTDYKLFFGLHLDGINLLPILMALIFYVNTEIQNRLQPKGTPEQESQKKMMKWMSTLLFPLFLYYGPSGLNLYILTSTLVGIIESKVIRKHIKEKEEAAKLAGPVVVDSPAGKGKAVVAAKRGGLMGWIQTMADRAEAVKRDADKKNRGGGSSGKGKR